MKRMHKEKEPIVYVAVNTLNKHKYIGITCGTLSRRKNEHKSGAEKMTSNSIFFKAIRKYGWENFNFYTLVKMPTWIEAAQEEIKLIELVKPEYNSTKGGEGNFGFSPSKEQREKQRIRMLGKRIVMNEDAKKRHAESMRRRGFREMDRFKAFAHLGPAAVAKKVICLDDGLIFESASAAARHYGAAKSAVIELCLGRKYRKTVNGLRFAYVKEAPHG